MALVPYRLGLLAWLLVQRGMVLRGGIVYDDGLPTCAPTAYAELQHLPLLCTGLGRRVLELHSLSEFVRQVFYPEAYRGKATVVAANQGRVLGLCAAYWRACRGSARTQWFWRGGFALGLQGAGRVAKRARADGTVHEEWNPTPHMPMIRVKRLGVRGYATAFARCPPYQDEPAGIWERDPRTGLWRPYPGRFVDVLADAATLDGLDTDDLEEHCAAFGVVAAEAPIAVSVDRTGASAVLTCCEATWQLARVLDAEAARW
jgi:hypothetical protein